MRMLMPSKRHGFQPLGRADSGVRSAIPATRGRRLFGHRGLAAPDWITAIKAEYERQRRARSNVRYEYVRRKDALR